MKTYPFLADLPDEYDEVSGVYFILNTISLRMRIGQSTEVYGRMMAHYRQLKSGLHTNKALQKDWNTFGEHNFEFSILLTLPSPFYLYSAERHLLTLEAHFMKLYRTKDPIYGCDFDTRVKKQEKVYEGFFAFASRRADQEIERTIGMQP